jgi:predicted ATPase
MFRTAVALEYARGTAAYPLLEPEPLVAAGQPSTSNFLLVDEIESGIHYSAIERYWDMIFTLARELDVQVFATTHSWDCIEGFQAAATSDRSSEGMLIRLEADGDRTRAVTFNEHELAIATREEIEVR